MGRHSSNVWNLVPLYLMWIVWKERNSCTFEDVSSMDIQLRDCFASNLFKWSKVYSGIALRLIFLSGLKCQAILLT